VERATWIRGIENIFTTVKVPEDKEVNMRTFYLTKKVDFLVENY